MLKAEISFLLTSSPALSSQECLSADLKACDFWLSVWLAHSYIHRVHDPPMWFKPFWLLTFVCKLSLLEAVQALLEFVKLYRIHLNL